MLDDLLGALKQGVLNAVRQRTGIDLGVAADSAAQRDASARGASAAAPPGPAPTQDPLGIGARRMPAGETVDAVLPAQAGEFTRSRINDRFGGIRSGGIFAGYRGDGVEIRVLVTLLRDAAAARAQVGEAGGGGGEQGGAAPTARSVGTEPSFSFAPGSAVWSRGAYCFTASSSDTDGDIPLPPTPAQIAALERFMRAFPY
ncbi:MAG: hypothetical protein ACREOQ_10330 [Gemmatimonadales bacterium]